LPIFGAFALDKNSNDQTQPVGLKLPNELKLSIKFATVETHRRNLLVKLGARNTAGLVRIGLAYGLAEG
jgi:hypothetical protein